MSTATNTVALREIAFSRSGDKGNIMNVNVIPFNPDHWEQLKRGLTVDVVRELYAGVVFGKITRYELPGTRALNFVMEDALAGGIATSLRVDGHGKSFQSLVLEARVSAPVAAA